MTAATLDCLDRLVGFDTISCQSNTSLIDWVAERLTGRGARLTRTAKADGCEAVQKESLIASIGPDMPGGLMLSAHTDVVPVKGQAWSSDPFRLRHDGDRVYGRGTTDMKGFLACCLSAMDSVDPSKLTRPIHLALSYDEELGCAGTDDLVAVLKHAIPAPALAVVGEPTMMRIVSAHKGARVYDTEFLGHSAHSSQAHMGVSSNVHAAHFVAHLDAIFANLRKLHTTIEGLEPAHTTFNVGIFRGGRALNIIPDRTQLVWEFRHIPELDPDQVEAEILGWLEHEAKPLMKASWQGADIRTRCSASVPALDPATNRAARDVLLSHTSCDGDDAVSFGTEAGFFQHMGIPTVVCGPGSITIAHKPDEWIAIDQLARAERMLSGLIEWASG
ncbi:MAG: acetylornithine deacetylase [Phyllobacteriaceae bacterium]|nr:acetylornithine deacetylase [Phyllobacteriaceae bacterium]